MPYRQPTVGKVRVWDLVSGKTIWPEIRDDVFRKFLQCLKVVRVCLVKNLKDPRDKRGEPIGGLGLRGWPICINATLHKKWYLRILIHELAHFVFPDAKEEDILEVERVLLRKFTKKQKVVLGAYIPKRFLKKIPARTTWHR
ncbi:MAG: hypothetical protein A3D65_04205 [Candidatus Lloydbacteria bacterium RIFCSPHIGHO2_02_FULL_50_13]|uniref:IrrE N-terminal-like domain-containing protein n=1 Tax=Candidatus Lloydbacteria bacterium RIFCSPHIGHO2_02_FULL_50_13 TaxID=1798661 RepID=A0A1G2DC63_9BACT|nr:MAG: hypothetical protein A3D65_04205 [Candidatus Lloydbacteria bacterium RIFCSPHIGHO2_02_FULL_50_13]